MNCLRLPLDVAAAGQANTRVLSESVIPTGSPTWLRQLVESAQEKATPIRMEGASTARQKQFYADICGRFGYTVVVERTTAVFRRIPS
jgi:hypothetical protein